MIILLWRWKQAGLIFLCLCIGLPSIYSFPPVQAFASSAAAPYDIQDIAAGGYHSLLLTADGTVWGWGSNEAGEVGNGTSGNNVQRPVHVLQTGGTVLTGVTGITAGTWHSAALKSDGTVWTWGFNRYGQLGDGTMTDQSRAVQVITSAGVPLTDVKRVQAAGQETFVIKNDGTLWGFGISGTLAGTDNSSNRAVQIKASANAYLTSVKDVAGSQYHVLALKEDGTVWAWGYGGYGALGNGSTKDTEYPVQVKMSSGDFLTDVVDVASNDIASFALKSDGTVWSWGNNLYGNLGNGGGDTTTAVQVLDSTGAPLTDVVGVAGGIQINVAMKSDGTLWWWGLQNSGYPKATKVNLAGVTSFSAGANFGVGLLSDGTIWSWGWNTDDQFGVDTNKLTYSTNPIRTYPAGANFAANPGSVQADGISKSAITVTLKDGINEPLTAGEGQFELMSTLGRLSEVTDNGNGTYSAELTPGSEAGTAKITGTINGYPLSGQGSVVITPLAASTEASTLTVNPLSLTADGMSKATVTVQLKDANGNSLTASGGSVTLSTTAGTLGPVSDKGDGTYTAIVTSPTTVGTGVVSAKLNGQALSQTANVKFIPGAASASQSVLSASPTTLTANGSSKSTITVQLKDANGNNLTASGGTVTLSTTEGTLGAVTDRRDGSYTAQLTAPTTAGTATVSGKVSGTSMSQTATVGFVPGPASAAKSTVTAALSSITADGRSSTTIAVQLRDANGNNLTVSGGPVTLSTTAGTLGAVTDHGDGSYTAELTAPTAAGKATISGKLSGTSLSQTAAVTFVPGASSAAKSTLTVSPGTLTADGTSKATVTVHLKDAYGNSLTTSGGAVALGTTAGKLGPVTDHGDGSYTAQLTAPTAAGPAVVSGKLSGTALAQTAAMTFVPGAASAAKSALSASESAITADGSSRTKVTVQLKDAYGNQLTASGGPVTLSTTAGALGAVTDHGNGSYTAVLTAPTAAGTAVISGKLSGTNMAQTATVHLVPGAASAAASAISARESSITADGSSQTLITVQLKDAYGNDLTTSGGPVTISTTDGTLGTVTDHGDGSYSAVLTASTAAGPAVISGKLSGISLTQTTTVHFVPGAASAAASAISARENSITSDGSSQTLITVQLKDAYGNNLTTSGGGVMLSTTSGTLGTVTDHEDGSYTAVLTAPLGTGKAVITGKLDGVDLEGKTTVDFVPGAASPETSLLTVSPNVITADGQSTSTITVQLKDAYGNNLTSSGGDLELMADSGSISEVTDYGSGTYSAVLTSSKAAGTATVTGVLNGVELTQTATVIFSPGDPSAAVSTVSVDKDSVTADGISSAAVSVRLKDENGNDVYSDDGSQVQILSSLGSITDTAVLPDGSYEAAVTSTTAGTAVLTATLDGIPLEGKAEVEFTAGPYVLENSVITAGATELPANGLGLSVITIEIKDAFGNLTDQHPEVHGDTTLGNLSDFTYKSQGVYTALISSFQSGTAVIRGFIGEEELVPEIRIDFGDGMFIVPSDYSIEVGGKAPTVVQTVDGSSTVDWTSEVQWQYDPEMIKVGQEDDNWYIYGLKPGTSVVSAVYDEGAEALTATASVTVYAVLSGLTLDSPSYDLRTHGQIRIQAIASYSDQTEKDVTGLADYHIDDPNIAKVDSDGLVTGLTAGQTVITATYGGQAATALIRVSEPVIAGGGSSGSSSNAGGKPPETPALQPLSLQIEYDQMKGTISLHEEEVKQGRIHVRTEEGDQNWGLRLSGPLIHRLLSINPDLKIEWATPGGSVVLPLKEIKMADSGNPSEGTNGEGLLFTMKRPDAGLKSQIQDAAKRAHAEMITEPFQFNVSAVQDGAGIAHAVNIDKLTFLLDDSAGGKLQPDHASAAVLQPTGQTFRFVPALFGKDAAGSQTATVLHKGFEADVIVLLQRNASFADLQNHWSQGDVLLLANKWLLQGKTASSFAPGDTVTRAELAVLLARALQLPEQAGTSIFEDVDDKDWYAAEVQSATKAGIIQGAGDGGFHPDRAVTRQEMALMISKSMTYLGKEETQGSIEQMSLEGFSDQEEIASWAHDAMIKIVQAGIMQGDQHGALRPDETCTRAEMAVMIVRMLKEIQFIN